MTLRLANRTAETSAELFTMIKAGLNCLDTVIAGGMQNSQTGIALNADFNIGSTDWQDIPELGDGTEYPAGGFATGIINVGLPPVEPGINQIFGLIYDSGQSDQNIRDEWSVAIDSFSSGVSIGVEPDDAFPDLPGVSVTNVGHVNMSTEIWFVSWNDFLQKIPTDATIIDAWIPITFHSSSVVRHWKIYQKFFWNSGFQIGLWSTSDTNPAPAEHIKETVTENVSVGFGIVGRDNNGDWHPLGSTLDSGTMKAGKQRIIHVKSLIERLVELRDSPYEAIGIYPGFVAGGPISVTIDPDKFERPIAIDIAGSYFTLSDLSDNGEYPGGNYQDYERYHSVEFWSLHADANPLLGSLHVQFQLPDAMIENVQVQYGNPPAMLPKA